MTKRVTILLSLGTAALLMTGCGSSSDSSPVSGDTTQTENTGTAEGTTEETTQKMAGFTTEWLNGKKLYIVMFDDFGSDEMKWNMGSMAFTNTTLTWEEYDTPSEGETYETSYQIENGMISIPDFEATVKLTQEQTEDYLVVCEYEEGCGMRYYFDKDKAQAYRDSKNNGAYIPLTTEMLTGITIYSRDAGENDRGYASMTFTDTEATRHEIWYNTDGTINGDETFSFPYDIVDGKWIVEDMSFSLIEKYDFAWIMMKNKNDRKGLETWYLSKPADFPEAL
jgi:hypothetical protein